MFLIINIQNSMFTIIILRLLVSLLLCFSWFLHACFGLRVRKPRTEVFRL